MEILIHRGTHQIGGCCTEIRTDAARIIIDMGEELPEPGKTPQPLEVEGVTWGEPRCDGVFFTHYHGDHIGQYGRVLPGIPLYMGETARKIYALYQSRVLSHSPYGEKGLRMLENARALRPREPVQVGDITVVPLPVDHSAYDAYMFLILAEDKRILHTGDFRLHGYRGSGVLPALRDYVRQVDVLITEGTALSRPAERTLTEGDVRRQAAKYVKEYKHTFVLCSSTNIDRLKTFYDVAGRAGRLFVCGSYQKEVLRLSFHDRGMFASQLGFPKALVYGPNLLGYMKNQGSCMIVRASEHDAGVMDLFPKEDSLLIYSMWRGYLDQNPKFGEFVQGRNTVFLHAGGHGSVSQIQAVCDAVHPRLAVIPIHTDAPERMEEVCKGWPVVLLEDGVAFPL